MSTKKRAAKSAELIPQPHGGALLTGGVPGNKGGTGRPPDWLKALKREAASDAVVQVKEMLSRRELDADQLIKVGKDFDPDEKETAVKHDITIRLVDA